MAPEVESSCRPKLLVVGGLSRRWSYEDRKSGQVFHDMPAYSKTDTGRVYVRSILLLIRGSLHLESSGPYRGNLRKPCRRDLALVQRAPDPGTVVGRAERCLAGRVCKKRLTCLPVRAWDSPTICAGWALLVGPANQWSNPPRLSLAVVIICHPPNIRNRRNRMLRPFLLSPDR